MAITIIGGDTNHTNQISQAQSNYWGGSDDSMGGYAASFNSSGGTDPALMHTLKNTNRTLNQMNQSMQSSNNVGKAIGWGVLGTVAAAGIAAVIFHNPELVAGPVEKLSKAIGGSGDVASTIEKNSKNILGDEEFNRIIEGHQQTAAVNALNNADNLAGVGKQVKAASDSLHETLVNAAADKQSAILKNALPDQVQNEFLADFRNQAGNGGLTTDDLKAKFNSPEQADLRRQMQDEINQRLDNIDPEKIKADIRGNSGKQPWLPGKLQDLADTTRGLAAAWTTSPEGVTEAQADKHGTEALLKTTLPVVGAGVLTGAGVYVANALNNNNNQQSSFYGPQYYYG